MKSFTKLKRQVFRLLHLAVFCCCANLASAQTTIRGVISDSLKQPLPGVSVTLKGTSLRTTTTVDGSYQLSSPSVLPKSSVLVAKYIGFKPTEITINGRNSLNVVLYEDDVILQSVVVTALGIKRNEKSLGYSAQTVQENAVKDAKTNNWVNSLSGKVAGLTVQGTGAGPMGSSRITLRGESSLNLENNQALIIVDGVPVSNRITGTKYSSHLSADSPVDYGSGVSDINPDDIEKITVLKGPGATALYGSRAAGGALIITTKSGSRKGKGLGITYNMNYSMDDVNRWPDYQFEYGEGREATYYSYMNSADGPVTARGVAAGRAWGPKFNGQMYFQYDPNTPGNIPTERTPWVANKNYISDFFRMGNTISNSISVEGGSENSSARLSLTHLKNSWILENTGYERINAALSLNQKISDKLKVTGKVNYTNKTSDNLPAAGYNNQSMMYFLILGTAPNIQSSWFKPYWEKDLEGVQQKSPFNTGPDNPYLDLYEMLNKMTKHGVLGNLAANYTFNPKLDLMIRSGVDMAFEERQQQRPFSMTKFPRGMYREQKVFNYEINTDALLSYKNKAFSTFDYSVSAGANSRKQVYDFAGIYANQLAQPAVYQISNSLDLAETDAEKSFRTVNSIYGLAQVSYNEKVFVDLTARNDWSSALPSKNRSFFYPSISSSFILNEIFELPSAISFSKLRLSWAQVGNDTKSYQTARYYDKVYGNNFSNPSLLFNANFKPEIITSLESGLDLRMFKNRLGLDVTLYSNNSRNQILPIPLDPVSGYNNFLVNAGLINSKGVEVALSGKPVVSKAFSWNTTLTWARNRSYVKELDPRVPNYVISNHNTNVSVEARVGGRMGDMYGKGFQRSPEGKIIYSSVGLPAPLDPVLRKLGNAFADWKGGLLNEFSIKNVRLSVLLDMQKGGDIFSQTSHKNNTLGKTKVTLPGRDEGIIGDGVVYNATTGLYTPNTVKVSASSYYDNYYGISNAEVNIYDASFLKIREVRAEFNLPKKLIQKAGMQQTSIAIYGRDLFNFTKFPGFDPESGNLDNGTLTPGVELAQFPSTRTMGVNLTFKF
ncbi:MAG: SusC/RagA family TonB-linked outer membrane protein [Pyrinomonadaceae bacterium]|nr:SusC/RagA family TonB-linked outer membrane protein [Sphingobacteriaceae bacterium]